MDSLLRVDSVRVEFGPIQAVRDVSFDLAGGQLLGLVGPNGAGKTTLLRVLAGLQAPTRGMAYIMGKPVLGEHDVVRHHVGFAPDSPPAYEDLTIDQFLRFIGGAYRLPSDETMERIDFWLDQLWLVEKRHALIKHLSKGMRQRVTLARTFFPRPRVILLDEPLSGLDPAGRLQLRNVLGMLRDQGAAMIVSSHILTDLEEVASHIAIIEQGRLLRWTTTAALHHDENERRTYRLTTLGVNGAHQPAVEAVDGVTNITVDGRMYTFEYYADESKVAGLLKRLVDAEVPVLAFAQVKTTLEEVYLRSGVKQVD
jgi:ABC-2 type transport system ATP-binding protein